MTIQIEPLSTILAWVICVCAIIFIPFAVISFIILTIRFYKEYYEEEDSSN